MTHTMAGWAIDPYVTSTTQRLNAWDSPPGEAFRMRVKKKEDTMGESTAGSKTHKWATGKAHKTWLIDFFFLHSAALLCQLEFTEQEAKHLQKVTKNNFYFLHNACSYLEINVRVLGGLKGQQTVKLTEMAAECFSSVITHSPLPQLMAVMPWM